MSIQDQMREKGICLPTMEEMAEMFKDGRLSLETLVLRPDELANAKAKRAARFDVGAKSEERQGVARTSFQCGRAQMCAPLDLYASW